MLFPWMWAIRQKKQKMQSSFLCSLCKPGWLVHFCFPGSAPHLSHPLLACVPREAAAVLPQSCARAWAQTWPSCVCVQLSLCPPRPWGTMHWTQWAVVSVIRLFSSFPFQHEEASWSCLKLVCEHLKIRARARWKTLPSLLATSRPQADERSCCLALPGSGGCRQWGWCPGSAGLCPCTLCQFPCPSAFL